MKLSDLGIAVLVTTGILGIALYVGLGVYEKTYQGKIYPSVTIGGIAFGEKTPKEVEQYWLSKNKPFQQALFSFTFEEKEATISGADMNLGYDAALSATQAHLVGRSGHWASDLLGKFGLVNVSLSPYFHWNEEPLDDLLTSLSEEIDVPVADALFKFSGGKVTAFRPSHNGRKLNTLDAKRKFRDLLVSIPDATDNHIVIPLLVDTIHPSFTTDQVNVFGIRELIGRGYSEFAGSIPGRIHNVNLAAAKLNGLLIKPNETFSFNDAVGDISASTGFQPAYIIKEGRTVLGDGGGVCQVSSTLFRAALAAGLPIIERRAHAYRVHYYEEGGFKPGLDATVFAPSVDLKIKNDTPGYILIQTKTDPTNLSLTFELYGTSDGRKAEVTNHQVWGQVAPPPDLYQDDPTLAKGVVKQVDFSAWGAKASFQYKVKRDGEVLQDTTFSSNFRPWQAVFLKGTQ